MKTEKKYAGWIAETFQESMDIALMMHRKKSENEYRNIAMKVFIFWIPAITMIRVNLAGKRCSSHSQILFDHHTDMQPSALWPLSCGSWVKEVLETNPYVKEVCVVGPPKESMEQCKSELASGVVFVTQEELREGKLEQWEAFLEGRKELPVYLSIDKDVLCMEDARTNWDQG